MTYRSPSAEVVTSLPEEGNQSLLSLGDIDWSKLSDFIDRGYRFEEHDGYILLHYEKEDLVNIDYPVFIDNVHLKENGKSEILMIFNTLHDYKEKGPFIRFFHVSDVFSFLREDVYDDVKKDILKQYM